MIMFKSSVIMNFNETYDCSISLAPTTIYYRKHILVTSVCNKHKPTLDIREVKTRHTSTPESKYKFVFIKILS